MLIKRVGTALAAMLLVGMLASIASAGNPHFVGPISVVRTDDSLTVSGKEAGLGNEDQVHILVETTAACLNPGGNFPQAENKESFSAEGDFPVQNGKALFFLTVTGTFQPRCNPPMTVVFGDVTITDTTHGISKTISGPF